MLPRVDAHQHFWQLSRNDYGWLTPEISKIYRDFMPEDLEPHLKQHTIDATVLVQAAPTKAETDFMLSLAEGHSFIAGVVGWTDFEAPDAPDRIAELATHPKLKGLRPMIQDIADDDWMSRADLDPAFRAVVRHGLVFDALVRPRHLDNLLKLLARYPSLTCVIDHCGKPEIANNGFSSWAGSIRKLARETKVFCKLSGLVTEAGRSWTVDALRPYVEHVVSEFGADRIAWGSDWPVARLAASYDAWVEATEALLASCSSTERAAILGGTANLLYRLSL